jgi:hypothetical protein
MAREAGLLTWLNPPEDVIERFKAFEALVRADERSVEREIVMNEPLTKAQWQRFEDEIRADEREACAKVCEDAAEDGSEMDGYDTAYNCAAAIRDRSSSLCDSANAGARENT